MNFQPFFEALSDEAAPSGVVVDVLVRPRVPFGVLWGSAVRRRFGTASIPVASIAHLIELKTGTGRSIVAFDIARLSQLKAGD